MAGVPNATRIAALAGCLALLPGQAAVSKEFRCERIAPGLYVGSTPRSEADYQELNRLSIKTMVDLRKFMPRRVARERCEAAAHGIIPREVPMGFHPTCDATPETVLAIMTDSSQQPVYVHCELGRDRTALIAALYHVRYLGWTPEAAYAAMQSDRFNPLLKDLDRYFWTYATHPPRK